MRTAVLADIHGNLPALRAVLRQIASEDFDLVVSAGDVVSGPIPGDSLEALAGCGVDVQWVMGNTDRGVIDAFDARTEPSLALDNAHPIDYFAAARLSSDQRDLLDSFQPSVRVGDVLICHGSPHSFNDVVTMRSSPARLEPLVEGVTERIIVGGHVHHQFTVGVAEKLWVNAGSVGMPYEGSPGAYWLALEEDGPEHRRTEYDLSDALVEIAETGYPAYDELARILRGEITAADAARAFEPGD